MPRSPSGFLGRGANGGVLRAPDGHVYKWTVDPVEVQAWLAALGARAYGAELAGLPHVADVRIGHREAVIVREELRPLGKGGQRVVDPVVGSALQRAARLEMAGRAFGDPRFLRSGRELRVRALQWQPPWAPIAHGLADLDRVGGWPVDVRPANFGTTPNGRAALLDPGRTPTEALLTARGEAWRRCPNVGALRAAVGNVLRHAPSYRDCRVVGGEELSRVMQAHGWSRGEIDGTAGFHSEDGRILLRRGDEWSLLHELVHAAGVVDQSLAPWLAEGITEVTAQAVAQAHRLPHTPTYERETRIVAEQLAPALGVAPVELGRRVAADPGGAAHWMAKTLARNVGHAPERWRVALGPGNSSPNDFLAMWPHVAGRRHRQGRTAAAREGRARTALEAQRSRLHTAWWKRRWRAELAGQRPVGSGERCGEG